MATTSFSSRSDIAACHTGINICEQAVFCFLKSLWPSLPWTRLGSGVSSRAEALPLQVGYFHGYIDGVDWVFVDHSSFHGFASAIYGGSRADIQFRCALLCKAALEAVWHVQCGGAAYGDDNLVFIANDWHTALLPVYLQVSRAMQISRLCCRSEGRNTRYVSAFISF